MDILTNKLPKNTYIKIASLYRLSYLKSNELSISNNSNHNN